MTNKTKYQDTKLYNYYHYFKKIDDYLIKDLINKTIIDWVILVLVLYKYYERSSFVRLNV